MDFIAPIFTKLTVIYYIFRGGGYVSKRQTNFKFTVFQNLRILLYRFFTKLTVIHYIFFGGVSFVPNFVKSVGEGKCPKDKQTLILRPFKIYGFYYTDFSRNTNF
jgi:hypothetical protein